MIGEDRGRYSDLLTTVQMIDVAAERLGRRRPVKIHVRAACSVWPSR
jgi:hypothetical protein